MTDMSDPAEKNGDAVNDDNSLEKNSTTTASENLESSPIDSETAKPTSTPTEKKMTLKERLEFAAKSKKKNSKKSKSEKQKADNGIKPAEINLATDIISNDELEDAEKVKSDDKVLSEIISNLANTISADSREQLIKQIQDFVSSKENESDKKIKDLHAQLNSLKKCEKKNNNINVNTSLLKKIEAKEEQIQNLLEEGNKLSLKEVTLTQSLKKLKKHETELEQELDQMQLDNEKLADKIENLEKQLDEFDDTKRLLNVEKSSFETLKNKYDSLMIANESLTDELKEIKFSKTDEQLKQATEDLNIEKELHDKIKSEYENLDLSFIKYKEEKDSQIKDLTSDLKITENNLNDIKRDTENEIKRLEEKLEVLRYQNENKLPSLTNENNINSKELELLQSQYDQAQENWKTIESSYLNKISGFQSQIEELNSEKLIYSKKIKILTNDLKQKSAKNSELEDNEINLLHQIDELRREKTSLISANEALEQNINILKQDFENEKKVSEKKLQELQHVKENLEASLKLRNNDFNISGANLNSNSFYLQDLSSSSSSFHFKSSSQQNNIPLGRSSSNKRFSISVGESSTTPRGSASNINPFSFQKLNNLTSMSTQDKILRHQASTLSGDSEIVSKPLGIDFSQNTDIDDINIGNGGNYINLNLSTEFEPSPTIKNNSAFLGNDEIQMGMDAESITLSTINATNTPAIGNENMNGGGSMNIQLVKRLGDHIRVLELEVSSLKDETRKLQEEKDKASEEIVKLIEDNSKVEDIKSLVRNKEEEIENLNEKYNKVLILLGAKEEKVGELTADVEDLKELLKQQVQEMISIQERANKN